MNNEESNASVIGGYGCIFIIVTAVGVLGYVVYSFRDVLFGIGYY